MFTAQSSMSTQPDQHHGGGPSLAHHDVLKPVAVYRHCSSSLRCCSLCLFRWPPSTVGRAYQRFIDRHTHTPCFIKPRDVVKRSHQTIIKLTCSLHRQRLAQRPWRLQHQTHGQDTPAEWRERSNPLGSDGGAEIRTPTKAPVTSRTRRCIVCACNLRSNNRYQ